MPFRATTTAGPVARPLRPSAKRVSEAASMTGDGSTIRSRTHRGEDLRQAVDEVEMALSGVESGLTLGNDCGQIASHGDRSVGVLLPVRQVHRRPDVLEAKSPRPNVESHLPGGPPAAGAEGLG